MKYALKTFLNRYYRCIAGATAIEYGLILAGLAVFLVVIIFAMGESLYAIFDSMSAQLHSASAP